MSGFYQVFPFLFLALLAVSALARLWRWRQRRHDVPELPERRVAHEDRDEIAEAIKRWDELQTKRSRSIFWE